MPGSKGVPKEHKDGGVPKGQGDQLERVPSGRDWNNLSNKINDVTLDCNLNYKVSVHEYKLI